MNVLVINVGSTTVKYDLYDMASEQCLAHETVQRTGAVADALAAIAEHIAGRELGAIGHRVVHGGEHLIRPTRIDDRVEQIIADCAVYAPIHNPPALDGIRAARARWPQLPHVAVFDTAFHAQMPEHAFMYALPRELYLEHGIRRYGFHGPSHQFMAACAADALRADAGALRLVTCHLGGGASVAAIAHGISIDTSMGMTPLEGLVMGTRSGDLDPAIPLLLARRSFSTAQLEHLFNFESGLTGLAGYGADFRALEAAEARDPQARLAIEMFVHRLRKYIGAYVAELGGADAIVFTGGIGENSALVRERVCEPLGFMGVALDAARNAAARPAETGGVADISEPHARTRVLVVHTEEERMIAREVVRALDGAAAAVRGPHAQLIPIGVSARHVHLNRADCDTLFGPGSALAKRRDITQPGQYITRETVDVIGPKGELRAVGIVAPLRSATQIELARTDARHLGIDPPVRESGHLDGTPGVTLRGPKGTVAVAHGAIIALRHVHMTPADALRFGVADQDIIRVKIDGDREVELGGVVVRVDPSFALDLHLDTDEANGAGVDGHSVAEFAGIERRADERAE